MLLKFRLFSRCLFHMKLKCPISLLLYVAKRPFFLYFQWKYFLFKGEKERERSRVPAWAAQPSLQLLECFRNFCTCFSLEDGQNTFWCSGLKKNKKREWNQNKIIKIQCGNLRI